MVIYLYSPGSVSCAYLSSWSTHPIYVSVLETEHRLHLCMRGKHSAMKLYITSFRFIAFETVPCYVVQGGLELVIFLPHPDGVTILYHQTHLALLS